MKTTVREASGGVQIDSVYCNFTTYANGTAGPCI